MRGPNNVLLLECFDYCTFWFLQMVRPVEVDWWPKRASLLQLPRSCPVWAEKKAWFWNHVENDIFVKPAQIHLNDNDTAACCSNLLPLQAQLRLCALVGATAVVALYQNPNAALLHSPCWRAAVQSLTACDGALPYLVYLPRSTAARGPRPQIMLHHTKLICTSKVQSCTAQTVTVRWTCNVPSRVSRQRNHTKHTHTLLDSAPLLICTE